MRVPVLCVTCGAPLGDKEIVFVAMQAEATAAALLRAATSPEGAPYDADYEVRVGGILDDLRVEAICCRTALMTSRVFEDIYNA